jgi:hypothetical protein
VLNLYSSSFLNELCKDCDIAHLFSTNFVKTVILVKGNYGIWTNSFKRKAQTANFYCCHATRKFKAGKYI